MEKLTKQEEAAMIAIWKLGRGYVKDFLDAHNLPKPVYTTLSSTIKNLEKKGYVKGKKYGTIIEYTPLIQNDEYKKKFMSGFVKNYFENSYSDLVTFFVNEKKISANELEEILSLIGKKKPKK